MSDSNPVPQVLGMLVFREYAGAGDIRRTLDCLRMAVGCLESWLQDADLHALIARLPPEAQARHREEARHAAAAPKRKRGRPAKAEAARQDPARVREPSDPAALTLEEASALEARQDAARADAARQQDAAGSPPLFFDPPQAAAD